MRSFSQSFVISFFAFLLYSLPVNADANVQTVKAYNQEVQKIKKIYKTFEEKKLKINKDFSIIKKSMDLYIFDKIVEGKHIFREEIGIDECSEEPIYKDYFGSGAIFVLSTQQHLFLVKDFSNVMRKIKPGMSKGDIKLILGIPFRESERVVTYATLDSHVAEELRDNPELKPNIVDFHESVRFIFENQKLVSLWIVNMMSC